MFALRATFLYLTALLASLSSTEVLSALKADPDLQIFAAALEMVPEIVELLETTPGITVLAPTDGALKREDQLILESKSFLLLHILQRKLLPGDAPVVEGFSGHGLAVETFLYDPNSLINRPQSLKAIAVQSRDNLNFCSGGGRCMSRVVHTEIVIHKLDRALALPQSVYDTAINVGLSGFANLILMAGLDRAVATVPDVTFFIPINEAIEEVAPLLWRASPDTLKAFVRFHMIFGNVLWPNFFTNATLESKRVGDFELLPEKHGIGVILQRGRLVSKQVSLLNEIPVHNGVAHVVSGYEQKGNWR
ncbi:hypothetical protein CBER1_11781 [Cercospora berteroae]|uniref:FAS1 domain-containing protein n=1 Tax=Cercospora berteroae TaxID=357750 RepID=A0A2S6C084_9PEZI|nr:hypothetical protein CBER1_11781 [Cercospora berteroae]